MIDTHKKTVSGNPDPPLALAGTLEYGSTALSERHNESIGQALPTEALRD